MKYLAAYLLAQLAGNDAPSTKDIEKVLKSVGAEIDAAALKKVVDELDGKNVEDIIAEGLGKLASVPSGGAAGSAAPAAGSAAPAAAAAPAPVEEEEEEDEDMGFGLFD
ncbi:60s acidic ribosomal protein-domain-containing protein [Blastocladiella britannica]|nr:60s acidic ribosomal protein-domain-containing protein [Blastocladiella britannica]